MAEIAHSALLSEAIQADQVEVLGKSLGIDDFVIATEPVPNLEYQEETMLIRRLIATVRDSEDILKLCIASSDDYQRQVIQVPLILSMAIERSGLILTEAERKNAVRVFAYSDDANIKLYLSRSCEKQNVFKALCEYSRNYFEHKYLLTLTKQAKSLIEQFLPEFAVDFPYRVGFVASSEQQGDNAEYQPSVDGVANIRVITSQDLSQYREYLSLKTGGLFESQFEGTKLDHKYQRKIHDLLAVVHEYAHGLFEKRVHSRAKKKLAEVVTQDSYYKTADAAYNEGFAVLVEFLIANKLISNADTLGLGENDIADIRWWKSQRCTSLIRKRRIEKQLQDERTDPAYLFKGTAYSEGFVRIFSRLYRHGGTAKVSEFLNSIDPVVSLDTTRNSKSYRQFVGYLDSE